MRVRVATLLPSILFAALLPGQCGLRDLLVANPAVGAGDWSIERQTSPGPLTGFVRAGFAICTGPGTVLAIEPGESFARGLLRVLVRESTTSPPYSRSTLYSFFSPFLRSGSFQNCPGTRFDFPSAWVVTDIKADQVFQADEAFWFVYLDTSATPARLVLQRGASSGPGPLWILSTTASAGFVSVNDATGIVYVVDSDAVLHVVDPIAMTWNPIRLGGGPAIAPTDMVYDPVPSTVPGRIVVVGIDPTNPGLGLLQRYTLAGALAYHAPMPGIAPTSLSVDDAGDYWFAHDAPGASAVVRADNATNALTLVLARTARIPAVSWIGRSSRDLLMTWPGTRAMPASLLRSPFVGDTALAYRVQPNRPVQSLFLALADRYRVGGLFLGPEGEVLVDPAAPTFVVVPVAGTLPDLTVPLPLACQLNGSAWHSQFFAMDAAGAWIASGLVSFTVGRRPRE